MNRAVIFDALRKGPLFDGSFSQKQVDTLDLILDEAERRGTPRNRLAYILATARHEVGPALQPISENLNYSAKRIREVWPSRFASIAAAQPYAHNPQKLANKVYANRMGNGPEASGDGWRYRGRGFPQLTGKDNYRRAGQKIGIDLVGFPALAMVTKHAVKILFEGMDEGWFTGHDLDDHIDLIDEPDADDRREFRNARRIINGTDAAEKISGYALEFERALKAGGYEASPVPTPKPSRDPVAMPPLDHVPAPAKPGFWASLLARLFAFLNLKGA